MGCEVVSRAGGTLTGRAADKLLGREFRHPSIMDGVEAGGRLWAGVTLAWARCQVPSQYIFFFSSSTYS